MATKEYAVFPVRAGTKGPWMVYSSTIQAEGLEAVRGKTMKSFNRHLAQAIPEGVRVAVIDRRLENPHIVIGCRPTAA